MEHQQFVKDTHQQNIASGDPHTNLEQEFYSSSWLKPSLGPHREDLNAKRIAFHAGPCWIKILVADRVAGSIIGKGGKVITDIENSTGCIMKLSPGQTYFPGTQERIVVIAGSLEGISEALRIILNKIRMLVVSDYRIRPPGEMGFLESNPPQLLDEESLNVDISVRAVVPNSAVSCIIGRGGEVIKDINRRTGAVIRIGDRLTIVHERIVQISGSLEQCHAAVHEVLARIQTDKNLKEHLNVVYTKAAMQSNRPPPILSSPTGSSETAPPGVPPPINIPPSVGASPIQTDVMSPSTPIPRSLIQTPSVQIPASSGSGLIHQVQTPSGPMPVNIFADVVGPSMYSQPCAISLNLPPGTISTSLFRKVEAQTGAQIRFRQQTGSVNVSGPFSAVHCAHILLLKETSGSGSPSTMSPPASPPSTFPPTATPSPVGGFHRHLRSTSSTTREDE